MKNNFKNRLNGIFIATSICFSLNINKVSSQVTYSFTTAGATSSLGPTQVQINAAYLLTNLNGSVVCPAGIQSFTVPTTGSYEITAAGAGGGGANAFGGRGRIIRGNYTFTAGDVVRIVVGQKGIWGNSPANGSSGGGGGSYVVLFNGGINTPILIAGGGAGFLGPVAVALPNTDANILQPGFNSIDGLGTGGAPGNGGTGSSQWGGGGGGYNTNGTTAAACVNSFGRSFINGSQGAGSCYNSPGGFGGGAGTHGNTGGGGGGGGYSGGGGSGQSFGNPNGGGGGGSFFSLALTSTVNLGLNINAGYVTILQNCTPGLAPTDVTPINNLTVCPNGSGSLSATGTGTLNWFATAISTLVLGTGTAFVTPTLTPGTYTYYVAASNTCAAGPRTPITLTVTTGPTIAVNSGTICPGSSFTMVPSGALTYTFLPAGPVVSPTASAIYTVIGTNASGCVSSVAGISNVSVSPLPLITVNSGSICSGQSFTMTPGGGVTYTFSGGTAVVSPTANTSYSVFGTNAFGCVSPTPAVANITVNPVPSVTLTGPTAMCIGQTITLTGWGAPTYSWSTGALTSSIAISPIVNTTYTIYGISPAGCGGSAVVRTVTVNTIPTVAVIAASTLVCKGESIILTASGADTYSWNTGALTTSIVVSPSVNVSYTVVGTNTATGCYSDATVNIFVSPCTGINEELSDLKDLSVYPNPNGGEFVIEIMNESNAIIYNMLGELILNKTLNAGINKISLNTYPKGVYFLQVKQGKLYKTLKVVKE